MNLGEWPSEERPREKLAKLGASALGDAELIALVLGTGRRGENVHELAMRLLGRFNGLQGLDGALLDEIVSVQGIGAAKAAVLKAAMELGRRTIGNSSAKSPVRSSKDLHDAFAPFFHGLDREIFYCAFLDSGLRLRSKVMISKGATSHCLVDTRLLLRDALSNGACSVAMVHNHPSGECRPSAEDAGLTERISASLESVGLRLLDHLIVCDTGYFSFADEGLIRSRFGEGVEAGRPLGDRRPPVPSSLCRP